MALEKAHSGQITYLCLPYDLERDIFELTAQTFPGTAVKLALVSSYVQRWMEMFLYKIVVLDAPFNSIQLFLRTFHSRPRAFFAEYVKHLYLTSIVGITEAHELVSACESAQTVSCWVDARPQLRGLHSILPTRNLRRLSMKLETLWGYSYKSGEDGFRPEDYPQLTHLELVNPPGYNTIMNLDWEGICRLPALTHLALGHLWAHNHMYLLPVMEEFLRQCQKLQVLVVVAHDADFVSAFRAEGTFKNPRTVLLPEFHWPTTHTDYWANLRKGGPGIWENAEKMRNKQEQDQQPCLLQPLHVASIN
ncbi:hypothetical protein P691DRAFT_774525 [Macrolepiota fuliginosa MF-IS2]|uniref:Uncharacterized protein n=1 Tax=Macrolepiota fuliginosa MF-IS2 TaxID=1400762 RepID=A0A9P5XDZ6_9AGAR|nr:hypothetical protein P691DRAFT_774525 [Macrolepiota fuliginosa MF-IS2]